MSVGINIGINDRPWTNLTRQLKDFRKETREAQKEVDKLKKDGKAVPDQLMKKLREVEAKRGQLEAKLKADGAKLRFQERFNARAADHASNLDLSGIIRDRIEGGLNRFVQGQNVQKFLQSQTANRLTAGLAGRAATLAQTGGAGAMLGAMAPVGMAVGTVAASWEVFKAGQYVFNPYSEAMRQRRNDYAAKVADRDFVDPMHRQIEAQRMRIAERQMDAFSRINTGGSALLNQIPLVGGLLGKPLDWIQSARTSDDRKKLAELEIMDTAQKAGVGQKELAGIAERAEMRLYADKYGNAAVGAIMKDNLLTRIKEKFTGKDWEEISKKNQEAVNRFSQFTSEGNRRAIMGDMAGAEASYAAGAKEIGRPAAWRDPLNIWTQNDGATKAQAEYALRMGPLPALRIGQ
ncbi:MAG TPA: hypothetical protein VGP72_10495 [Planctomycetota bacterium]|jgi:hypothetical protein